MVDLEQNTLRQSCEPMRAAIETRAQEHDLVHPVTDFNLQGVVDGPRTQRKVPPHAAGNSGEQRVDDMGRARKTFRRFQQHAHRRRDEMLGDRVRRIRLVTEPGETAPGRDDFCGEARFSFAQITHNLQQIGGARALSRERPRATPSFLRYIWRVEWPTKKPSELDASEKKSFGKGVFRKCDGCSATLTVETMLASFEVCPECGKHHKLSGARWRDLLLDDGKLEEWDAHLSPTDPLNFSDGKSYRDRIASAQKSSQAKEAIEIGRASIDGQEIAYGAFLFAFMGGSMGSVVGEKIARLFERATSDRLPVVLLQASGGARMQEGILSLMQMAKTVSALERFRSSGAPFFSILLHPTTGGVAASFALLGDVNIAEPNALIGFAGPRVIEQTIRQKLPDGFQQSEFLLAHGMIDRITSRLEMRREIATLLHHLAPVSNGPSA